MFSVIHARHRFEFLNSLEFARMRPNSYLSRLYIETRSTATAARSGWISHYFELASDQFHGEIDLTAL